MTVNIITAEQIATLIQSGIFTYMGSFLSPESTLLRMAWVFFLICIAVHTSKLLWGLS